MTRYAGSPEEVARRFPELLTARRFDLWASLFEPGALMVRVEAGTAVRTQTLEQALPEQIAYGEENRHFVETWEDVSIVRHGNVAVVTTRYTLEVDREIRRGLDVLTLACDENGWRIVNLAYEQTGLVAKQA